MKYTPVIGLEVHIELGTQSKMFCPCPADHFAKRPNTQTCPVCLGLPGALPVPSKQAIRWAQTLGAALECTLAKDSKFDRKHYFYPDLPKGYQISQYDSPLCYSGNFQFPSSNFHSPQGDSRIRIRRVHLEEDTGKLIHQEVEGKEVTLVDFNRSGVPLVEIVTEPDFTSTDEVVEFVKELHQLVRDLGISDADMEKGSMRLEANISLRDTAQVTSNTLPNYKVELKNINSFRFLRNAIEYEIERQAEMLNKGETLVQETRGYDEAKGETRPQRTKEEAQDYRYFPEPDIPSLEFSEEYLAEVQKSLPELPGSKRKRFEKEYGITAQYAAILTQTKGLADYFEEVVRVGKEHGVSPREIANVIVNKKPDLEKILPAQLVEMLLGNKKGPVLSNEELETAVVQSIKDNPKAVKDYKQGKESALQFLLGQVMAKTQGQAQPEKASALLKDKLTV